MNEEQQALEGFSHKVGNWITISECAKAYEVSDQTIRDWIADKIVHKPIHGQLNFSQIIKEVYLHQRMLIEGKAAGSAGGRYQEAKAAMAELELRERTGDLVNADEVRKAVFELARSCRDALENIPSRVSAIIAAESDQNKVKETLTREIWQALQLLVDPKNKLLIRKETEETAKQQNIKISGASLKESLGENRE